jgi:L-alanine-DL-glutamate epimerase-like enolase superfamily enzyme
MQARRAIASVQLMALDVPLKAPFTVASAAAPQLANVAVRLIDGEGRSGWGEVAILPPITTETQSGVLALADELETLLLGANPAATGRLVSLLRESCPTLPALVAGVEMALLDLAAQAAGLGLWEYFGAFAARLATDITIPLCSSAEVHRLATGYAAAGFTQIKLKVGQDLDADIECLQALVAAHPEATVIIDANGGYTESAARTFAREAMQMGLRDWVFEQPVEREDGDGLAALAAVAGLLVVADESARSAVEVQRLAARGAVHGINIKMAKSGVQGALEMITVARSAGLRLMIGGMVETRLGMGFSAQLAGGLGGFDWCDLDTPLLLATDPIAGGYVQNGPFIELDTLCLGHGASVRMPT